MREGEQGTISAKVVSLSRHEKKETNKTKPSHLRTNSGICRWNEELPSSPPLLRLLYSKANLQISYLPA